MPYFAPTRPGSRKIASCRGISRSVIASAVAKSPASVAACICAQSAGATLAVTEMQPTPPWALKPSAVASSPDIWQKSVPQAWRVFGTRDRSPVASLTPTIIGCFASSAMVATLMSTTDRPGML